jgi:hypothetical protein
LPIWRNSSWASTVSDDGDIDAEIRHLISVLTR